MRSLASHEILEIWERGQYLHTLDRAMTILEPVFNEMKGDRLGNLPIATRDAMLFDLYERTFGSNLNGFAQCPECREHLEFSISSKDILMTRKRRSSPDKHVLHMSDERIELTYRLPNSFDLAAVIDCGNVHVARDLLAKRCVLEAMENSVRISENDLPPEVFDKLAQQMAEDDPLGDVLIDLSCPGCSHQWKLILDIVVFLWTQISMHARRLLREVHILASAYKWRETDILAMSPNRRQFYIDMVS